MPGLVTLFGDHLVVAVLCVALLSGCGREPGVEASEEFRTQLYRFFEEVDPLDKMCGAPVLLETKEARMRRVNDMFASLKGDWQPGFSTGAKRDFAAAVNAWESALAIEKMLREDVPTRILPHGGGDYPPTAEDARTFCKEASQLFANGKHQALADLHR